MSKRVLAMALAILAFFMFVGSPFQQTAAAIAGVDDAFIAILIAALAAVGIVFTATGGYGTVEEFVRSIVDDYCTANNTTTEQLVRGVDYGVNKTGKLLLNNRFVVIVQTIAAYIVTRFDLVSNTSVTVVAPGTSLNEFTAYQLPVVIRNTRNGDVIEYTLLTSTSSVSCIIVYELQWGNGVINTLLVSNESAVINETLIRGYEHTTGTKELVRQQGSAAYWHLGTWWHDLRNVDIGGMTYYNLSDVETALRNGDLLSETTEGMDIDTGTLNLPYDDANYTDGDGALLDVEADWGLTISDITTTTIPIAQEEGDLDTSLEYEGEETVADQVEESQSQVISQNPTDYQLPGLQDVFPFCIPFDIYAFFECLAADPVAPSFTWRFYIPGICDEDLEIDLAAFDSAARILRTMELLLFIVGLAFVTRDKFLRG